MNMAKTSLGHTMKKQHFIFNNATTKERTKKNIVRVTCQSMLHYEGTL